MNHYMPGMLAAMVILIVPAFFICTGLSIIAYKRWQADRDEGR